MEKTIRIRENHDWGTAIHTTVFDQEYIQSSFKNYYGNDRACFTGTFTSCSFIKAKLSGCIISGTFDGCDFAGADFSAVTFRNAKFTRCDFSSVNFSRIIGEWKCEIVDNCNIAGIKGIAMVHDKERGRFRLVSIKSNSLLDGKTIATIGGNSVVTTIGQNKITIHKDIPEKDKLSLVPRRAPQWAPYCDYEYEDYTPNYYTFKDIDRVATLLSSDDAELEESDQG